MEEPRVKRSVTITRMPGDEDITIKLAQIPGQTAPWMKALETLQDATTLIDEVTRKSDPISREHGFYMDKALLQHAIPFMWNKETTNAVLQASHSIPAETLFNSWNLDTPAVWWWFEEPLPFKTLEAGIPEVDCGVRALCFGWVTINDSMRSDHNPKIGKKPITVVGCSAWCDDVTTESSITPSQTWVWEPDWNMAHMLKMAGDAFDEAYGPGGYHERKRKLMKALGHKVPPPIPIVTRDQFVFASESLSRFILAGLSWLNTKVVQEAHGHIERHRRKEFVRKVGRGVDSVRVISLRRIEHTQEVKESTSEGTVKWRGRWKVEGFWRNQACGPNWQDRRLMWINDFEKGPKDLPLLPSRRKIYKVDR